MDIDGHVLGHLAVLHDEPLPEESQIRGIFEIFAGRAAAELRRLRRERARRLGWSAAPPGPADVRRLRSYSWPGNVRELQNVIERAVITSPDKRQLNLERALPDGAPAHEPKAAASRPAGDRVLTAAELREFERENLLRALELSGWKVSGSGGAADRLGMRPKTLGSRMKALGIRRPAGDS
jgi:transcriptional regulator with GAF, ATPase, and Fis domain